MPGQITTFGFGSDGRRVDAVTIGGAELTATILTRGAILQDVRLQGVDYSLTLGGDSVAAYEGPMGYFGALVGPVANRIAGATAEVGGKTCHFPANERGNLLHSGLRGLHARIWTVDTITEDAVTLRIVLEDGDDDFPGRREIRAMFRVEGATLHLGVTATTDAPTLMNLANHAYWNLDGTETYAGHMLRVGADHYLPVDAALIPTGEQRAVSGAFDLRQTRALDLSEGYDHNFCVAVSAGEPTEIAELTGTSGIRMSITTTEPGLQIYCGERLATGPWLGHNGVPYGAFAGLAMEPQRWPDAPHHPAFPSITLSPGATYRQDTRWSFSR